MNQLQVASASFLISMSVSALDASHNSTSCFPNSTYSTTVAAARISEQYVDVSAVCRDEEISLRLDSLEKDALKTTVQCQGGVMDSAGDACWSRK